MGRWGRGWKAWPPRSPSDCETPARSASSRSLQCEAFGGVLKSARDSLDEAIGRDFDAPWGFRRDG
jgi:hypothetical protein